jgi:hypothetical protein
VIKQISLIINRYSIGGISTKILEKIIKIQLLEYLDKDKIIFNGQCGRKNIGTGQFN